MCNILHQEIATAIAQRLQESTQDLCIPLVKGEEGGDVSNGFIASNAGTIDAGMITTARALSRRQFWRSVKLQTNMLLFDQMVSARVWCVLHGGGGLCCSL
jgi:hypothetical protein